MLFVVIGFTPQNCHGAIQLLDEQKSYHLMAERHLTERNFGIGALINRRAESVCPANDECKAAHGGVQPRLQLRGKRHTAVFLAMLIEQYNETLPHCTENEFAFLLLLLILGQVLGVLEIGYNLYLEWHIVFEPLIVRLDQFWQFNTDRFANYK